MDGLEDQRRGDWQFIQLDWSLNEVIIHREDGQLCVSIHLN